MSITDKQRHQLKRFIKELEHHRGRHTELVSVYVPAGYEMSKIINHLAQEQGTASNIKSTSTRKNVTDALERMIQHLRLFSQTPPHGLVAFSGNVAEREGQSDVRVWSLEPPIPINTRLYRCDKEFVLNVLKDICEAKETYGLVVLDRRDARIALLRGKSIIPLVKTHSEVPGKFKAGGQSSVRFERQREGAARDHYQKVGAYMKEKFLEMKDLKGILLGGPGPTKYEFFDGNFITNDVKKKIIAIKDLSYTDDFGLQELVDRSQDVLANEAIAAEKQVMEKFFGLLAKNQAIVSYGMVQVKTNLEKGAVDILLLSEDLDDAVIDEFEKIAEEFGTDVRIISTETREGVQLRDIGKIAAILRYEIKDEA